MKTNETLQALMSHLETLLDQVEFLNSEIYEQTVELEQLQQDMEYE